MRSRSARPTGDDEALTEARWQAVLRRDRQADGDFVYCVTTTGIYCRPSCGARRPRRENVAFHANAAAAERAGFRACRRCRPADQDETAETIAIVSAACRMIEDAETPPTLAELAVASGLSERHFHRLFREVTGVTPRAFAAAHRRARMQQALSKGEQVTHAYLGAGYGSSSRFYSEAQKSLGMPARSYRDKGRGVTLSYATACCSLGTVLVATTAVGVAAILIGEDAASLLDDLKARFALAHIETGGANLEQVVASVVALCDDPGRPSGLALDLMGTSFQQLVWAALTEIPAGATTSYGEIARRLGKPAATRAVARAIAANPIAIAVPCHRVIGSDGALTGYRWGLERKRALLDKETAGALGACIQRGTRKRT